MLNIDWTPLTGHMLGSECNLKMHVRNLGISLHANQGPEAIFSTTSQLDGKFSSLYLLNKNTIYTVRQVCWKPQGVCYIAWKCHELRSRNGSKLDHHFYSPSYSTSLPGFADGDPQTELNQTPDFAHMFWNRTHFRARGRFWFSSVQRARKVADEDEEQSW